MLLWTVARRRLAAALLIAGLSGAWLFAGPRPFSAFARPASPMPPQLPNAEEVARLRAQSQAALAKLQAKKTELTRVTTDFEAANDILTKTATEIAASEGSLQGLEAELRAAQAALNARAASVYRADRLEILGVLVSARSFREFVTSFGMLRAVAARDAVTLDRVQSLKTEASGRQEQLRQLRVDQEKQIVDITSRQREVEVSLQAFGREYQTVQAELTKRESGFAFPVRAPYSYVDSYGAPRMVGTQYYHRHEGVDVFALKGTPVVAVVDGVLERVGTDYLGGIKLWLRSPGDGWTYYYAHLSGYAPGMRSGTHVRRGTVVGYVGNSGNARGTPPHLHFETHVPGGRVTNPYPIVRRADPLER